MIAAVVPAAGKGERFAAAPSAKLLVDVRGEPLITHTIRCLLDGGAGLVVVVISPESVVQPTAVPLLSDPRIRLVVNPDPSRGMFSSIQIGVAAADGDPILVLPGDMPFVQRETVGAVIAAFARTRQVVSPRFAGRRGHPIALPASLRVPIAAADPAGSLNTLLAGHAGARVDLDVSDRGILRDVDVAGDL